MDAIYQSAVNRDVPPASAGEFGPLCIGALEVWQPVVLAPMAGVTNYPFRALCRRFGAGLYVSEMITARAFVEGHAKTLKLASFGPYERRTKIFHSLQVADLSQVKQSIGPGALLIPDRC